MLADKQIKQEFKRKASKNPNKHYPVQTLKELGYNRRQCHKCKTFFWSINQEQKTCGDPNCTGGYSFIENSPAKNKLTYIEVWLKFSNLFRKLGYTPIKRYPVIARWNPTSEFVLASITDFQPYVVKGEVNPPADHLIIPQPCLRFNDLDNIGITGSHYSCFIMIGQHAFVPKNKYNINQYLKDIYSWLDKGLGLKKEEITFHEDAWAGGGNFGPCIEYFSRGLELGNQVYMQYEQLNNSYKELNIKVLDMGMGQERNAWFSQGTPTSYETTFPTVIKKLSSITDIKTDSALMKKFLPYSSLLNIDEVSNINKAWNNISEKIKLDVKELKEKIMPLAALYSIAEHSRALLFAISDGALPSNTGGGYNLRVILRRSLSLMDKYNWQIYLPDLCKLHALYLKPLFPELLENLNDIENIINVEIDKYKNTKQKFRAIVEKIIKQEITENKLLQLYDSQGITPEIIKDEAGKLNKRIVIPENFYAKITELHEKKEKEVKKEIPLKIKIPPTKILFYQNENKKKFSAKVLKIIKNNVILDKTYFYPRSGGQEPDLGFINNSKIINVEKANSFIIHHLDKVSFKENETVKCKINWQRRTQLNQHHTAAHIINAAARRILGNHINQNGAFKDIDKARLDITHYQSLSEQELKKIENEANKIIKEKIPVYKKNTIRNIAEKKYGMRIYQGGYVPGKEIRIIEIPEVEAEACSGIHVNNTSEIERIVITKSTKISDSIVRIEFKAGNAALEEQGKELDLLNEISKLLNVSKKQIPSRAKELFEKWKETKKAVKKNKLLSLKDLKLTSTLEEDLTDEELLKRTAFILKTQPEHVPNTIKRFLRELEEFKKKN